MNNDHEVDQLKRRINYLEDVVFEFMNNSLNSSNSRPPRTQREGSIKSGLSPFKYFKGNEK